MTLFVEFVDTGQHQIDFGIPNIVLESRVRKLYKDGYDVEEVDIQDNLYNNNPKACVRKFIARKR